MAKEDRQREVDFDVAVKVMGWERVPVNSVFTTYQFRKPDPSEPKLVWPTGVPHYSTDIAAAFLVVQKLFDEGYVISLHADGIGKIYRCNICTPTREIVLLEEGASGPEAICRAALATTEDHQ